MQYIQQYIDTVFDGDDVVYYFSSPPNLSNQQFINVQFIDADLRGANVRGAHFHDVQFIRCNTNGVDFSKARFTGNGNGNNR